MIKDRYQEREICSDTQMERYWRSTLAIVRPRYKEILRLETIKFDPLVSKYFEGEYTTHGENTGSSLRSINNTKTMNKGETSDTLFSTEMENSGNGSNSTSRDHNFTITGAKDTTDNTDSSENKSYSDTKNINGSNGGTSTTVSSNNETVGNTSSSSDENHNTELNRHAVKNAPMNASGVTSSARGTGNAETDGMLDELDFEYVSLYEQSDKESNAVGSHSETGSSNTVGAGQSSTTDSYTTQSRDVLNGSSTGTGSVDRTIAETKRDQDSGHEEGGLEYSDHGREWGGSHTVVTKGGANSDITRGTDNTSSLGSIDETRHERYTGREGILPQDAIRRAIDFLETYSTAFEWLCNKLEPNFIGVFNKDNY